MSSNVLLDGGNKTIAAPMYRLDQALCAATVAQSTPHRPEPLCEGALTDTLVGPELFHEFVFGDDAIAMLHEVDEHVEALALKGAKGAAVAEFVTLCIELVPTKGIEHAAALRLLRLVTLLPLHVS
jgi:hypothetical protein